MSTQLREAILRFLTAPQSVQSRGPKDMFVTPSDIMLKADLKAVDCTNLHGIRAELLKLTAEGLVRTETRESASGEYVAFAIVPVVCPFCQSDKCWVDSFGTRFRQCPICTTTAILDESGETVYGYYRTEHLSLPFGDLYLGYLDVDTYVGRSQYLEQVLRSVEAAHRVRMEAKPTNENLASQGLSGSERVSDGILAQLSDGEGFVWFRQIISARFTQSMPAVEVDRDHAIHVLGVTNVSEMEGMLRSPDYYVVSVTHEQGFVIGVARSEHWKQHKRA